MLVPGGGRQSTGSHCSAGEDEVRQFEEPAIHRLSTAQPRQPADYVQHHSNQAFVHSGGLGDGIFVLRLRGCCQVLQALRHLLTDRSDP